MFFCVVKFKRRSDEMKNTDFTIRDPFILPFEGKYYLYGTTSNTSFSVYVSCDLENWSEPVTVFEASDNFKYKYNFWAPEVHYRNGSFYLFGSFKSDDLCRATQILKSDNPLGPFIPFTENAQTPECWECLDGTLYIDKKGVPFMVFCHEWLQVLNGEMCYARLSDDLSHFITEPKLMFKANDYPVVAPSNWHEQDGYVTDGPFMHRCKNGELLMIWSSNHYVGNVKKYCQIILKSDNSEIDGNWIYEGMLFEDDGGHGMLFKDFDGNLKLCLHQPNKLNEHLEIFNVSEKDGKLSIIK